MKLPNNENLYTSFTNSNGITYSFHYTKECKGELRLGSKVISTFDNIDEMNSFRLWLIGTIVGE